MLNLVRQHANSWIVKSILWLIVFAFVATIFYSWGMGGATSGRGGVIATVEGLNINAREYDQTYSNLINFYREQFRNQFSEDLIQKLDLKTQALDALIQRKLLLLQAERQHIMVSDAELIDRIKNFEAFQKDNKFDQDLYQNYLRFKRLSPMEFEESQREALIIEKIEGLIKDNVKVSESELMEAFRQEEEKIKLEYITFSSDHFKSSAKPSDEDLEKYFQKNKEQFEIPEQIRLEYIKLEPSRYEAEVVVRNEDIEDYYQAKISDFRIETQYKASHILFRLQPPGSDFEGSQEEQVEAAEKAAKQKAENVFRKIKEGASFEDMAKEYSEDTTSGKQGGSLGEFAKGLMVPEFDAALNKLKIGEISEPIRTSYGFHIIRLEGKTESRIKPLSEVQETITKTLKQTKARQRARRIIKRIKKSASTDQNLVRASSEHSVDVKKSGLISRKDHTIPEVGMVPEFFNTAFSLGDNQVSEPINTPEASYLIKVVERIPPYIPELSEVRKRVLQAVERENNRVETSKNFNQWASSLNNKGNLETIARDLKMEIKYTPFFSRIDSIPGVGNIKEVKDKVFELKKGEYTGVTARRNHYLIRVADIKKADQPDEDQRRAIMDRLVAAKANIVFQDWLKNVREKSAIMIDQTLL